MARVESWDAVDPVFPDAVLDVRFKITSPGCRAQTWGPPENCYPEEPMEIELLSALNSAGQDVLPTLTTDQAEAIELDIVVNFNQSGGGDWC